MNDANNPVMPIDSGVRERPVSIVIPVFNKVEHTQLCTVKLIENTPGKLFGVVFVDNASTDGTGAFLGEVKGPVRVITNAENLGFVGACNQGAAATRSKYIVFLNNDTAPQAGWLEALIDPLERDPSVGATGARLVYPDGRLQEAGGLVFQDGSGWNFGRGDPDPFAARYNAEAEVDYCSGAALAVRRDVFERLGGFDVRYAPAYYEDTDLCFGVRTLGLRVLYCPRSIVVHFEGITAGTSTATGIKRFQPINQMKFVQKWQEALKLQDASPAASGRPPVSADRRARGLLGALVAPARPGLTRVAEAAPGAPRVLVVDPTFPWYDRASGSLRLFQIVKALRKAGCGVTYLARNGSGQDRYQEALEAMGVVTHATDPDRLPQSGVKVAAPRLDLASLLGAQRFDLAWLSFFNVAEQYLPELRNLSPHTRIAVDTVDVHFLRQERTARLAGDEGAFEAAQTTRRRELRIYGQADLVITVTQADGEVLQEAGMAKPIRVVPNMHDPVGPTPGLVGREGLVFVGNFNHPPNIDAIHWFCDEIMPILGRKHPTTHLTIVGFNPPPDVKARANRNITVTGWVPETAPYLDAARVSVAPLRVGAGMKGKVGEALSRGLPVVATRIAAEGMGLEHDRDLLIADEPEAFAEAIGRLLANERDWLRLAEGGRRHIEQNYSVGAVERMLGALLEEIRLASARRATSGGPIFL